MTRLVAEMQGKIGQATLFVFGLSPDAHFLLSLQDTPIFWGTQKEWFEIADQMKREAITIQRRLLDALGVETLREGIALLVGFDSTAALHSRKGWITFTPAPRVSFKAKVDFRTAAQYLVVRLDGQVVLSRFPKGGEGRGWLLVSSPDLTPFESGVEDRWVKKALAIARIRSAGRSHYQLGVDLE